MTIHIQRPFSQSTRRMDLHGQPKKLMTDYIILLSFAPLLFLLRFPPLGVGGGVVGCPFVLLTVVVVLFYIKNYKSLFSCDL